MYQALPPAWIVTVTFSAPAFSTFTTGAATPENAANAMQQTISRYGFKICILSLCKKLPEAMKDNISSHQVQVICSEKFICPFMNRRI